jgi:UMF1 family MFS transporter
LFDHNQPSKNDTAKGRSMADIQNTAQSGDAAKKRALWSWALYDAGNSAFATIVIAGFFPICFKTLWSSGADAALSTARLGIANTIGACLLICIAPLLGAFADATCSRKRMLGVFTAIGIVASMSLALVPRDNWAAAAAVYIAGLVGFSGGAVFYDALLPGLAPRQLLDRVSALGYSLGYISGGVLLAGCVLLTLNPHYFGLGSETAVRSVFVLTALWWLFFSLPLFRHVPEPRNEHTQPLGRSIKKSLRELISTLKAVRSHKQIWLFLLAYWCYIDGVHTIIRMAVDYGMALGFASSDLIVALLITQFIGFPCALLFGWLGTHWDTKKALLLAIGAYCIIVLWGMRMQNVREFFLIAGLIGVFQGGIQALSRSFFARMIPAEQSGQFFGFFNMVGKWAAILGPALMGLVTLATGNHRIGIASLLVFFIVGAFLLVRVKPAT